MRRLPETVTGDVTVEGRERLRFEVRGDGPPVLMLMGLGVTGAGWEPQARVLAERFRVVTIDQRGVGATSGHWRPLTISQLARDARAVLDQLGIGRAHVVGLSMGGMVSIELAGRWPERIDRLVLCCAPVRADLRLRRLILGMTYRSAKAFARAGGGRGGLLAARDQTRADWIAHVFNGSIPEAHREFIDEQMRAFEDPLAGRGLLAQTAAVLRHDARGWARRIRAHTLVVAGTRDRMIPLDAVCRTAQAIAGSRLVFIEGGPHGMNVPHADELNRHLLEFLAAAS
ncbi:MAG: alpha/beta fold hydrolase [Deltaproteobacteria bacterium]